MIDRNSRGAPPLRKRGRREGLTGGAGGVGLDGLALLDEFVLLGRGGVKSSLDGGTEDGGAQLGGDPRGVAEDLALSEHFVVVFSSSSLTFRLVYSFVVVVVIVVVVGFVVMEWRVSAWVSLGERKVDDGIGNFGNGRVKSYEVNFGSLKWESYHPL